MIMRVTALFLVSMLSACTSAPTSTPIDGGFALLKGDGSKFRSAFNPLSPIYGASFHNLDGNDLTSFGGAVSKSEVKVSSGEHKVLVGCSWSRGGLNLKSKKEFIEVFEAGRVYLFKPGLGLGGACELSMEVQQ